MVTSAHRAGRRDIAEGPALGPGERGYPAEGTSQKGKHFYLHTITFLVFALM